MSICIRKTVFLEELSIFKRFDDSNRIRQSVNLISQDNLGLILIFQMEYRIGDLEGVNLFRFFVKCLGFKSD